MKKINGMPCWKIVPVLLRHVARLNEEFGLRKSKSENSHTGWDPRAGKGQNFEGCEIRWCKGILLEVGGPG